MLGGALTAVALLLAVVPESVDYLLSRRAANSERQLKDLARRRLPAGTVLVPAATAGTGAGAGRARHLQLFDRSNRRATLLIWVAFFATMFGFYFVSNWTPMLLVIAGTT